MGFTWYICWGHLEVLQARVHDVGSGVLPHFMVQLLPLCQEQVWQGRVGDLGRDLALHEGHAVILFDVALPLHHRERGEFEQTSRQDRH